ncbi:hypothetical protein NF556_12765 [Ornithinimicrobium faecis]|uniref:ABC transporter permease n=1 Tax=Ornithinimicrobium faecis TaxID=2934158 RepID=A0ABY4YPT7_9MICO|nr:hypothetical protein [Ornithinimicrobium sp. HY1793]USQ78510.1 hypothetical protein NF556_12765 [Ornithinimicrobium sp. HY1793]
MTTVTEAPATARRTPQWRSALTYLLSAYVYMLTLWFWAIALPVVAIIMFIVGQNVDQVTSSGVAFLHHGALWFPFSIAIILSVTYLPIHVANGMTRRSFTQAALCVSVVVGLLNAAIATGALLIEREIYDVIGWVHGGNDGSGIPLFNGGVLVYAMGLALLFIAGQLSGSLIGIAYYRLGGIIGTVALPLCLLPLAAVGLLGLGEGVQWNPWSWTADIAPWGTIAAVLSLIAAAGVFHLLVRDVAIDSKD